MQAVILAAGLGRRLGRLTARSTKCMLPLNGRRLIEHTLDAVLACGLDRAVIVVGHGGDEVRAFVGSHYRGLPVHYVVNPEFATTNNVYSLLLAADWLRTDDSVVLESDVVFEAGLLRACLSEPAPEVAAVAPVEPWMNGTLVEVDAQSRRITRFLTGAEAAAREIGLYKTVNVYKLSRDFLATRFVPFLETYVQTSGRTSFYEEVLRALVYVGGSTIVALSAAGMRWYEIDDANDLDIANTIFAPDGAARLDSLERRYGGYWRFPELLDFYYLVNPFFPTPELEGELARDLSVLIRQYPSGSRTQALLAGKLLGLDPSLVTVGNGASELISALLAFLGSATRVGVVLPTFEPYRSLLPLAQLAEWCAPAADDFVPSADALLQFAESEHLGALVLTNPANPTGATLRPAELRTLLEGLERRRVRLVLDESFTNFVDGSNSLTLATEEALVCHPGLVIVKSISKAYGVPGLRLGVLASGDAVLLKSVTDGIPIWNVNALAEAFLQRVGRYDQAFQDACRRVAEEREWLHVQIETRLPFLRPLPSGANFLLCEVRDGRSARELAEHMLVKASILCKACSGKRGLEGAEYLRFAVRARADNQVLVDGLRALRGG